MGVRDFIFLTLFFKLLNLAQLLCHFGPILTSPNKFGQTVEQPKQSQQNLVPDHHGHPVEFTLTSIKYGALQNYESSGVSRGDGAVREALCHHGAHVVHRVRPHRPPRSRPHLLGLLQLLRRGE